MKRRELLKQIERKNGFIIFVFMMNAVCFKYVLHQTKNNNDDSSDVII